ncbi:hypothetical protein F2P45_02170 [Massilia sp. CCM 8733]|uniref:DUF2059 domain-containing protein n=1 Tax=Massilia mucilaginosa TaxID=2609282 RepID=A0ABX0NM37_9BURK|nr:hypothetical protein [Massilia mucilaginosa]NHZ87842.1 hypothetical protein [Massilia mucilaginosa]
MQTRSAFLWRLLAQASLALLALTQAAQAAPATKASLRAYFEATGMARQMSTSMQAIAQAQQDEWQAESDPVRKAAQKGVLDDFNARMRTRMVWSKVEPLALASYQAHLSESDVKALLAHARTPAGQLRYHKLNPAMLKQLPAVQKYLLSVLSQVAAKPAPAAPAAALAPAGPDQALLLTYLRTIPGEKEDFEENMAAMEDLMGLSIDAGGDAAGETLLARTLAELKAQLSFDQVTLLKARLLSGVLSDAELALLIDDNRRPQRREQLRKLRKAEQQFQRRMINTM